MEKDFLFMMKFFEQPNQHKKKKIYKDTKDILIGKKKEKEKRENKREH
jgi:hypothetical protein